MVKPGAVLVDIGINRITDERKVAEYFGDDAARRATFAKRGSVVVGDVHPAAFLASSAYTPVPGGVGALTIAMLMSNTVKAARLRRQPDRKGGLMLRVGLTGGLGSGKSTVAAMLARRGAKVFSADEIGRSLMQPGEDVFAAIVQHFGTGVVREDGTLDRAELARLAFSGGRIEELNAIVHPATIARQEELVQAVFAAEAEAIVVIESALIFETLHGGKWRERFDRLVLVTAPDWLKVERFVSRSGAGDRALLEAEAHRRLARMMGDDVKAPQCDFVIANVGSLEQLEEQVEELWGELRAK